MRYRLRDRKAARRSDIVSHMTLYDLGEISEAWPDWKIWRSDGGSWMATRRRTLSAAEIRARLAHTLMEPDAEKLVEQLVEQAQIAESLAT